MAERVLLEVEDLDVDYLGETKNARACNGVSFTLHRGEILGVAGESASGKSTLLNAVMRLQRPPAVIAGGAVRYHREDGTVLDLARAEESRIRPLRWVDLSIVMQSAMACLNPVLRLRSQFDDVLRAHEPQLSAAERERRGVQLLEMVGISGDALTKYPHELSGGMRQRSLIALAMACDPELVVMDEPTTAVDVVMQRQILEQILTLQEERGFAIIFVTHDLSLLLEMADRIAVMYAGRLVEVSDGEDLVEGGLHPYAEGLRSAFPTVTGPKRTFTGIPGSPPHLTSLPPGCPFAPRCAVKVDLCDRVDPPLEDLGGGRMVACHVRKAEMLATSTQEV
ncbi:ABC transporter ATP-binding protein [Brachybacterium paraconglomeratum]|uniref:ABC transporter ATP-binding protein n=1 Tax=Brachybacterium paraconglomeratum TaxID=173362 RepID=UPI003FD5AE12